MSVYNTLVKESQSEVERLGMDENWIDVTQVVETRLRLEGFRAIKQQQLENMVGVGHDPSDPCYQRLYTGGVIARELREKIRQEHGLTVSAGISYNKLLAKLGGGLNKPDNQTVIGRGGVETVLRGEAQVRTIPGVGRRMADTLETGGIVTVAQLRAADPAQLVRAGVAEDTARMVQGWARGRDPSKVKMSGRVGSIGLEDRFKEIRDRAGVRDKLQWLIDKLEQLIIEDGRQATTFKVTIRDYFKDKLIKKFHKESRQCRVSPRLFHLDQGSLRDAAKAELVELGVGLVAKMINMSGQFHLTLLGVAVTDFVDHVETKGSIRKFFSPKKSETCGSNDLLATTNISEVETTSPVFKKSAKKDISSFFNNNDNCNKKRKLDFGETAEKNVIKSIKCETSVSKGSAECPSDYDPDVWNSLPESIQRDILEELRPVPEVASEETPKKTPADKCETDTGECPPGVDPQVFCQLPEDIKSELIRNSKQKTQPNKIKSGSGIRNYFSAQGNSGVK